MTTATKTITFAEAAKLADPNDTYGIHESTLHGWVLGVGGIRLDCVVDGDTGWQTTPEAIERFMAAIHEASDGKIDTEHLTNTSQVKHLRGPLLPVLDVPRCLEISVDAKTVRGWITRGLCGVKLEAVRCLGRVFVTPTALAVFLNAVENDLPE